MRPVLGKIKSEEIETFEDWSTCLKDWCIGKSRRSELLKIPVLAEETRTLGIFNKS